MNKPFLLAMIFFSSTGFANSDIENLALKVDCGNFTNRDQFASFGYEQQLYTCREVVVAAEFALKPSTLKFFIEWAPLYESIQYKAGLGEAEYRVDPETGASLDAQTLYLDWYNNIGDRTYFLGEHPLIEAKLIFGQQQQWHLGRQKIMAGAPVERFWRDNSAIGPYADWLARDLFSGLSYRGKIGQSSTHIELGAFSGDGNPLKGYSNYGAGVLGSESPGGPNVSSNNTPTWNARLYSTIDIGAAIKLMPYASYQKTVSGSTWWATIDPSGKHNRTITTIGLDVSLNEQLKVYAQGTQFLSGLSEWSLQNEGHQRFKDITQQGYFIAAEFKQNSWLLGMGYEQFDRYDFNIFYRDAYVVDPKKKDMQQHSLFGKLAYQFTPQLAFEIAAHQLQNPLPNYSEIFTKNPETGEGWRYAISVTYR